MNILNAILVIFSLPAVRQGKHFASETVLSFLNYSGQQS
jgi:hypothetical protein